LQPNAQDGAYPRSEKRIATARMHPATSKRHRYTKNHVKDAKVKILPNQDFESLILPAGTGIKTAPFIR
jgi:hypothetical protein